MSWRIRQAGYADLEAAAHAKELSFLDALLPDDALLRQPDPRRISRTVELWGDVLEGGGYLWVVVGDLGEILGVAQAGLGRDDDAPTPLELYAMYLRKVAQGSGVANALLRTAIGDSPAYLWVPAGSVRAQAFYRRCGFAPDGTTKLAEGLEITEERWVRE